MIGVLLTSCGFAHAQNVVGLPLIQTLVSASDERVENGFFGIEWRANNRLFVGWKGSHYRFGKMGAIDVLDAQNGKCLRRLTPDAGALVGFGVSSDGGRIAGAFSTDRFARSAPQGQIWVWDAATGAILSHFELQQTYIHSFAFSPDGKSVAAGGGDDTVHLFRVGEKSERWKARGTGYGGWVNGLTFSSNGARLYVLRQNVGMSILESVTGKIKRIFVGIKAPIDAKVAVSPREDLCYIGDGARDDDGELNVCVALPSARPLWTQASRTRHSSSSDRAVFSPDGRFLARYTTWRRTSAFNGSVCDARTGRESHKFAPILNEDHDASSPGAAFSPDSQTLAVAAQSGPQNQYTICFYILPTPPKAVKPPR